MKTTVSALAEAMRYGFERAFPDSDVDFSGIGVTASTNPAFGDFQCNDAMPHARTLKQAPRQIAEAVLQHAELPDWVASAEIAGPGFINLTLSTACLDGLLMRMRDDERLAVPMQGEGQTVVIDYSSPNVAKPMHIGHIRSIDIGGALDRVFRYLGYHVVADNHIGDWGTQFGIIIKGYREMADEVAMATDPIGELERIYVASYEKSRADENWLAQCRAELVKLQSGDPDNVALWQRFIDASLVEFDRVYGRLGVSFDLVRGESYYRDSLAGVVARLEAEGLAKESEGATVVFLEEEGLPVCIVRKSDGGFNYATTDIATVLSRVEEFSPQRVIYVTDERQQLHFKQFFAVCKRLGVETPLQHVWFGLMRLPEGTFSTREGNVIKLEKLLDEAESRALAIVKQSSPEMPEAQQKEVARAVGVGAVKYADLSQNPQTLVTFTWDKAMALEGNSGPYLQYAYARIASVHSKYEERFPDADLGACAIQITEPIERHLAGKVLRFPEMLSRAAETCKPSVITDYLYELAQAYSTFYQNVPFLKAPEGVRESRVHLCMLTARVLQQGLALLGIETPERI